MHIPVLIQLQKIFPQGSTIIVMCLHIYIYINFVRKSIGNKNSSRSLNMRVNTSSQVNIQSFTSMANTYSVLVAKSRFPPP